MRGPPPGVSEKTKLASQNHLWYHTLGILNKELGLGLNFTHWVTGKQQRTVLGLYSVYANVKTAYSNLLEEVNSSLPQYPNISGILTGARFR